MCSALDHQNQQIFTKNIEPRDLAAANSREATLLIMHDPVTHDVGHRRHEARINEMLLFLRKGIYVLQKTASSADAGGLVFPFKAGNCLISDDAERNVGNLQTTGLNLDSSFFM